MLVLSRRMNESIVVGGQVVITVLEVKKNSVRLGIQAPPEISVHREEVRDRIELEVALTAASSPPVPLANMQGLQVVQSV